MRLMKYEPWGLLNEFNREINRLMASGSDAESASAVNFDWAPPVDIKSEETRYVMRADLPGVEPDDIEVTLEKGVLTIKGERKHEDEEDRSGYHRVERSYGTFYRRFTVPDTVDSNEVSAKFDKGVLEIVIPKQAKVLPKKIEIAH